MAGIGKQPILVVSLPEKIVDHSLPCMRPACGFRCTQTAPQLFEKVMGLAKVVALRREKSMTPRSRQRKQTPQNVRSLPSENLLVLPFIDPSNRPHLSLTRSLSRLRPLPSSGSCFIPMTQLRFRVPLRTMGAAITYL